MWFFTHVVKTITLADHLFFPRVFTGPPGKCSPVIPLTELETVGGEGGREQGAS